MIAKIWINTIELDGEEAHALLKLVRADARFSSRRAAVANRLLELMEGRSASSRTTSGETADNAAGEHEQSSWPDVGELQTQTTEV